MYHVYILECNDGSYYIGQTANLRERVAAHESGDGAVWTARRLPVKLVYYERHADESLAVNREQEIKGWSRQKKEQLIKSVGWRKDNAVAAYALLFDDEGRILLMKHADRELWMLPGGGVEDGEDAVVTLTREVKEETGLNITITGLVGVDDKLCEHQLVLCFLCKAALGEFRPNNESSETKWFEVTALPIETLAASSRDRLLAHLRNPEQVFYLQHPKTLQSS